MKNKKGLIVLVAILVLFIALYFVIDSGILEKPEKPSADDQQIPEIDLTITGWSSPAVRVKLENANGSYTFDRTLNPNWSCEEHINYPLNKTKLDELAAILGGMTGTRRLEKNDNNMELFGLNSPVATLTFSSVNGLSSRLIVGSQNQATTDYYVCLDEINAIFMMSAGYIEYFLGDIISFVDVPEFPEFSIEDATYLEYSSKDVNYSSTRLSNSNPAHSAMISAFNSMYVSAVVDPYTEDFAKYGLDNPEITATVKYDIFEGGLSTGEKEFTLKIGNADPQNSQYRYITLSYHPNTVYKIFYMSLEHLTEAAAALPR